VRSAEESCNSAPPSAATTDFDPFTKEVDWDSSSLVGHIIRGRAGVQRKGHCHLRFMDDEFALSFRFTHYLEHHILRHELSKR
jgi:hypothetical protein